MGDGRTPLIGSDARTPAPDTPPYHNEKRPPVLLAPVPLCRKGKNPPRFPQNADRPFRIMEENGRSVMV